MGVEFRTVGVGSREPAQGVVASLNNESLFAVRSSLATLLGARIQHRALAQEAPHLAALRLLRFGDISGVDIVDAEPGMLKIVLHPSERFAHRDPAQWLGVCVRVLREHVANHIELFSREQVRLRWGGGVTLGELPEHAASILVSDGAAFARSVTVDVSLGRERMKFICLEVRGGVERWGEKIIATEKYLGQKLGLPVHIFPGEYPDDVRRRRVTERLLQHKFLKGALRILKAHDDPKPKLLHYPVDLTSLEWWAFDDHKVRMREDCVSVVDSPAGPYLLVAYPARVWSNRFHQDDHSRVFFCGGLIGADGTISRMRVGEGLTSEILTMDSVQVERGKSGSNLPECALKLQRWNAFAAKLEATLGGRLRNSDGEPAIRPAPEKLLQGAIRCAQEILVSCVQLRAAPFVVRRRYTDGKEVSVLRGDELILHEHDIPLKARYRGGLLNQEQLLRALALRAPLLARDITDQFG